MPASFWPWLVPVSALFLLQVVRLACQMLPWPDESAYVHLGYLAVAHKVNLFQDEMMGARVPRPFYVIGVSQLLWGRNLFAARLLSLAFGLSAVILSVAIARRIAGNLGGILTALFIASNGVLVGYFAIATYHAFAAAILLLGLALMVCIQARSVRRLGDATLSVLVLVRTNLWTIPPAIVAALIIRGRSFCYALSLMAAGLIIPRAFFAWDVRHLKILTYVPVIDRLVHPMGFRSTLELTAFDAQIRGNWWGAILRSLRMCESKRFRYTEYPAYFPSWAPLGAILLGVGFARAIGDLHQAPWRRHLVQGILITVLLYSAIFIRHPLLPVPPVHPPAMVQLNLAAGQFTRLIPPGSRVFLWGNSLPLYLAGRDPYLQQIYSDETLAAVEDTAAIRRTGLWGSLLSL